MSKGMLPSWPRRHFEKGGGNALLFYKVHGKFDGAPAISRALHRCEGVPPGCKLQHFSRSALPDVLAMGLDAGWIGDDLRARQPELASVIASSDECMILRGEVPDPDTLDYFRDAVGLVQALLESGGVAVFDPHMFKWWSAEEWRERAFEPAGPVPRHHVVILVSDEEDGRGRWYHTRGMRRFGRPDISVHDVLPEHETAVEDLCNRFIEMMAFGAVIAEGQPIRMRALPDGWRCRHGGDLEDPDFNNVHVDIGP